MSNRSPHRRRGHSLMELSIALVAASVLTVGMGSSVFLALKASDVSTGAFADSNSGADALARLNRELRLAVALNDSASSSKAVEFTVPDITGDAMNDTIRWEWSGTNGDPLTRTINGGAPETVAGDVRGFTLSFHTKTVSETSEPIAPTYHTFTAGDNNGTSVTVSRPSGTTTGDLLIAAVAIDGGPSLGSLTAPTGWTLRESLQYSNKVTLGIWSLQASAAEPSTYQFSWSGDERSYAWIMRFSGHDSVSPINALSSSSQNNSSSPPVPSVTTTVDQCLILRVGAFDKNMVTVGDPGVSAHTTLTMDTGGGGGGSVSGGAAYTIRATHGDTGATNFTLTGPEQSATATLAVAPNPVGAGTDKYYNRSVDSSLQVGAAAASTVHSGTLTINEPEVSAP